jgi:hypothetical protein
MPTWQVQRGERDEPIGERLARLRKPAGDPQRQLAAELGTSHPLPALARALGVSADQLLGLAPPPQNGRVRDTRLWCRSTRWSSSRRRSASPSRSSSMRSCGGRRPLRGACR